MFNTNTAVEIILYFKPRMKYWNISQDVFFNQECIWHAINFQTRVEEIKMIWRKWNGNENISSAEDTPLKMHKVVKLVFLCNQFNCHNEFVTTKCFIRMAIIVGWVAWWLDINCKNTRKEEKSVNIDVNIEMELHTYLK